MTICILTDVTLWPPEYSKCDIFAHMEERGCIRICYGAFLLKNNVLCFLMKESPTAKSINMLCVNRLPCYLSINLSICVSIYYFISVSLYQHFHLLNFFGLSFYIPSIQGFCSHLNGNSPHSYHYEMFPSFKKLVMTNLRVLHYVSL